MADSKNSRSDSETEADLTETKPDSADSEKTTESQIGEPTFGFTEKSTFDFTEKSRRTDFALVVEGKKLYVAKTILSLASPVFKTMFLSDYQDSSSEELELPGKKLNDVTEFLRCIYRNPFTRITRDNALIVLPLVEEFKVLHLKPRCEYAIMDSVDADTTVVELFRLLKLACLYDLIKLRAQCIQFASKRPEEVLHVEDCESFPPLEAFNEVLKSVIKTMGERLVGLTGTSEENQLFKEYLSAESKQNEELNLNDKNNWKEQIVVFSVKVNMESLHIEKQVIIWGVPLTVIARFCYRKLTVEIKIADSRVACSIKVRCILINRQPNSCNHVVYAEERLRRFNQRKAITIQDKISIEDGYIQNGNVGVIVQLYMSEPNQD